MAMLPYIYALIWYRITFWGAGLVIDRISHVAARGRFNYCLNFIFILMNWRVLNFALYKMLVQLQLHVVMFYKLDLHTRS